MTTEIGPREMMQIIGQQQIEILVLRNDLQLKDQELTALRAAAAEVDPKAKAEKA